MTNGAGSRVSHRRQQMWVYVITGLFVCDFILCGYIPSQQRLVFLQRAKAQQRQIIDMAAAQSAELAGLERRVRGMETAVEGFDHRVPAERALGTFLLQIGSLMKDFRLIDQDVVPGKELKTEDLHCIPIYVACKGTLTDIFGFFARLQSLDRLVRIERVTLENDTELTGRVSLRLEAVIFEQAAKPRGGEGLAEAKSAGGGRHGA
ncbi:MAG: hypothetical protein FJ280_14140 [Planctomycetes bacterium]|nr:hypothetical protein [Planctomycetota bacterium]